LINITPDRPDWYVINGTTELDIINIDDNCCEEDEMTILWTINFSNGYPPVSGTGQPSEYDPDNNGIPDPIMLWGTTDYTYVLHTITYVLTDCNGNSSLPVTENITMVPRPNVIKIY
jgi:hypothetical protein